MTTAPKPRGRPKAKPVVPVDAPIPAFLAAIQAQVAAAPEPSEPEVLINVPDLRVTRSVFAAMLQVSLTTLQSYEVKGLIIKIDGRIDALASIRKIIGNLREVAGNRSSGGSEDGPNVKELKLEEEIRQLRLANAKAEGQLVDINSVHTIVRKTLIGTADWLESLPDAFEQTGIINPGMVDDFIRVMDNQREMLMSINLKDIALDGSDEPGEPQ